MTNKLLTAIIPLRLSAQVYEAIPRLRRILDTIPADIMDILIVDYGSSAEEQDQLDFIGAYTNVRLYRHASAENTAFSIGHARDLGAQYAMTDIILFHDIDFICSTSMYHKICIEISNRKMKQYANDFFCIPVAFLNQAGNTLFYAQDEHNGISDIEDRSEDQTDNKLQYEIITNSKSYCHSLVYGSSAIVVNRYHYLTLGGHHRKFSGHGAEDYDILHRLSYYNPKAPRTSNYYDNLSDSPLYRYQGFRTYFALHGMDVFMRGIYMLHLYHPPRRISNYHQSRRNFPLLKRVMIKFDTNKSQPSPLQDISNPKKTLILAKQASSFADALRYAIPAMGEVVFIDETHFPDSVALVEQIKTSGFTHVGFKNPYGNQHRLALYKAIKKANFTYWVFDRGALPDSWFFDANGFNADSDSYKLENWNKPLNKEQQAEARLYIDELCHGDQTLEKNGKRRTEKELRKQFNIGNRKVIFIPFQRPTDSVCKYFSGCMRSAQGFSDLVSDVTKQLDTNKWVVLGKKHPLESKLPEVKGVSFVDDTHIHDLLSLADYVLVLNSGVGLLAGLFKTPVIYLGNAFYGHDGINYAAKNSADVLSLLQTKLEVNQSKVERFIYYLIKHIYSFGESSYTEIIRKEDGAKLNLVNDILFSTICGLTERPIIIGNKIAPLDLEEPLFFSFGGQEKITGVTYTSVDNLSSFTIKQRLIIQIVSFLARPMLSINQRAKLKKHPERFFRDANNGFSRFVAKILAL